MTPIQFLGEWVVRSSILILVGALLAWLLRLKNPSIRLTAWKVMLAGSLAIPLLNMALPKVPLHVSRARSSAAVLEAILSTQETRLPSTGSPGLISAPASTRPVAAKPLDWIRFASILYALAAGALLLRLFAGLLLSRRILRQSRPTGMLAGKTEVRESGDVASPVTAGILRPAILIPLDWRGWDSATLDAVLAHERSHIRRRDPAVQSLSAIHCALLWANPLSWFLHRNIVRTAEEISDDDAIEATRDRASYAEILLEFMRRGTGQSYSQVIPMARYDRPEKRIRRILNSTAVPRGVTRWSLIAILVLAAPLAYFVSAADPRSAPQPVSVPARTALPPSPVGVLAPSSAAKRSLSLAQARAPQSVTRPAGQSADAPDWQTKAGGKMSFEVASVKQDKGPFRPPNFALDAGDAYAVTGGRFFAAFGLSTYVSFAYKLSLTPEQRQDLFAHLPKWVAEDRFEIQAKATEANPTKDQMRLMMQALLAERFKLAVHFETKESPVLALVLVKPGKLGPKLLPHAEGPPCDTAPSPDVFPPKCYAMMMTMGSGRMQKGGSRDTTMTLIAGALPSMGRLERPVVDQTGLSGRFDFAIEWSPETNGIPPQPGEPTPDMQGPSFQAALREQLGLKLESTKAPLQILVIDHLERPSEN